MNFNKFVIKFNYHNGATQEYVYLSSESFDYEEELKIIMEKMCDPIAYFNTFNNGEKNGVIGIKTAEVFTYDVQFYNVSNKKEIKERGNSKVKPKFFKRILEKVINKIR